jgi:hypothetical protein
MAVTAIHSDLAASKVASDASPKVGTARGMEIWALLVVVWLATIAAHLFTTLRAGIDLSTDDAMRLVEVRDLLAGQSWFDLTQYRLDPPTGVVMHWSRLIDLPLALLIRAGELVLPAALAERVAMVTWPALLLLVFLGGVARLARELAGDAAARLALIFAALSIPMLVHFRPGAIDHHNAQLALLVWSLALACRGPLRPRDAALAGVLSAVSLAIGLEMAPAIAALAAAMALRWIVEGTAAKATAVAFALALAATTAVLFVATVPPARYGAATCDALSIAHVVAAGIGGLGLAALAGALTRLTPWGRLAGGALLAAVLAAALGLAFPQCLGDPFAGLDPRISTLWLANVNEMASLPSMLRMFPQAVLPCYGLPAAALAGAAMWSVRETGEARWRWAIALAVLAVLFAMAVAMVRATAAADAVAAALLPAALVRTWPAADGRAVALGLTRVALVAALLLNPLALTAIGAGTRAIMTATGGPAPSAPADTCRQAADYAPLAQLPRGRVLAVIDAGPFVLLATPHAVLAAPYHRNVKGIGAMFDVFLGPTRDAQARLAALGVDYIVVCPGAAERANYAKVAPDGFGAALSKGEVPAFLERIALDATPLAVYRARH